MSARKPPAASITVCEVEIDSKDCGSAPGLAAGFGGPIFEPTWWPADTGAVTYLLDKSPSRIRYRIGSTRRDGTPIVVIGDAEQQGGLPDGNWSRPPELEVFHGLVRRVGAYVHAVVNREQQTLHLIGYASEAEVARTLRSLRRVSAEPRPPKSGDGTFGWASILTLEPLTCPGGLLTSRATLVRPSVATWR
jgi:hypothetical protein